MSCKFGRNRSVSLICLTHLRRAVMGAAVLALSLPLTSLSFAGEPAKLPIRAATIAPLQAQSAAPSEDPAAEADRQAFARWAEFSNVFSLALLRTMEQAEALLLNAEAGPGGALGQADQASSEAARISRAMLRQVDRELDRSLTVPTFRDRRLTSAARATKTRLIDTSRQVGSFINEAENFYLTATRREVNLSEERDPLRLRLEGLRLSVTNLDSRHAALTRPPESVEGVLLEAAFHMGEAVRAFAFAAADSLAAGEGRRIGAGRMETATVEIDYAEGLLDEAESGVNGYFARVDAMQRILLRDKHALKRLGRAMRAGVKNERELAGFLRDGINAMSSEGVDGDKIMDLLGHLREQREDRQMLEVERSEIRSTIPPNLLLEG